MTATPAQPSSEFTEFLKKLKDSGKTDEEIGQLLSGIAKLSAVDLYTAIMTSLTEDDMKTIEGITDEAEAKKKMEELFAQRTGMSVDELAKKSQEAFVTGYSSGS